MRQLVDVLNLECVEQRVAACLERPAKGRESRKNGVTGLASQSRLPRIARNSVSRLGNCQREQRECQNSCTKCKSTRPMVTHTGPPTLLNNDESGLLHPEPAPPGGIDRACYELACRRRLKERAT